MVDMPAFQNYGDYSSSNYGAHTLQFFTPEGTFWFSYKTLVAFAKPGYGRVVHENDWGPTTGKHLNWIDGGAKNRRVSAEVFGQKYQEAFGKAQAA